MIATIITKAILRKNIEQKSAKNKLGKENRGESYVAVILSVARPHVMLLSEQKHAFILEIIESITHHCK